MIIRLPCGSDSVPELVPRATPMDPGTVSADTDTPDPGQHRRFGPLSGAKTKRSMYEMPTMPTPGHSRRPLRTGIRPVTDRCMHELLTLPTPGHSRPPLRIGTRPVTDRFMYEMPTLPTPGHSRPPLRTGTQPVTDRFMYEMPTLPTPGHSRPPPRIGTQLITDRCMHELLTLPTSVHSNSRPQLRTGTQPATDFFSPQQAALVNTVTQLQFEALKFSLPGPSTSATWPPPAQPRPAVAYQSSVG